MEARLSAEQPWEQGSQARIERAERKLAAQYEVARALAGSTTLRETARTILGALCEKLGWQFSAFWLVDEEQELLVPLETWHAGDREDATEFEALTRLLTLRKGVGIPGRVWESGKPEYIADVTQEANFPRKRVAQKEGLHAGCAFPIVASGQVIGVIDAFTTDRQLDPELIDVMTAFGGQIGQFIERNKTEEALRRSEARKTAILEAALDCIVTMDHTGRVVEFNRAAEETFGYERSYAIGRQLAELIIPKPLRKAHYEGLAHYLETGEGPVIGRRIEVNALRADGSEFPCEVTITRVPLPGAPVFTGYLRDITERKQAENERARLLDSEARARAEAEAAQWRLAFLAEASTRIASTLDYQTTLQALASLTVPVLADWCLVDVTGEDAVVHRVAIAHADPAKAPLADELRALERYLDFDERIQQVLQTGRSVLIEDLRGEQRDVQLDAVRSRLMAEMAPLSMMIVPLLSRGRILGAISFLYAESDRRYTEQDLVLAEDLARRAALPIDNARLFQERTNVARALQRSLLPPHLPEIPGLQVAASYEAAGEGNDVGGDFYDIFRSGRRRWTVVIGDVSGKGADAAALTGLARYTLRATSINGNAPSRVLPILNNAILQQSDEERFATVALALLELERPGVRLTLASAGHPLPLLLRKDGTVERVGHPGTILGVLRDIDVEDATTRLMEGDSLVFFTDGVSEAGLPEEDLEPLDLERLLASCNGQSAEAIAERIRDAALELQSRRPRDDIAVVVIRVNEAV